jgi:electron transfer flavoprotein beta subunit
MTDKNIKIAVCVKEVPENCSGLLFDEGLQWPLNLTDIVPCRMNKFDEYAVEAAIQIKELIPGTTIDIISLGHESAAEIIRRAMGMGADNGYLIKIPDNEPPSPQTTPVLLAGLLARNDYDFIFTGIMSEDEMKSQTGPMIAAILNMPAITGVSAIEINKNTVEIKRESDAGIIEHIKTSAPIVLCVQPGINIPRYPSLTAILKAQSREIQIIGNDTLSHDSIGKNPESTLSTPKKSRQSLFLAGSVKEKAEKLFKILQDKNVMVKK